MAELPQLSPRCMFLHSKTAIVHGESASGEEEHEGTDFWCIQSGRSLGPDNGRVNGRECRDSDRGCYREY